VEVSLDDDSDVSLVGGLAVEGASEVESGLGVFAAFHVDADEVIDGDRVIDEAGDDFGGEGGVEVHAHLGELEAYVGVELAGSDGVEKAMINVSGAAGLVGSGDVFAEAVEGGGDALILERLRGAENVVDVHSGDETGGHAAAE